MSALNLQPLLASPLVTLRPLQPEDWEGLYKAASNPKTWAGHIHKDRYKESVFRPYFDGAISSRAAFAIIDNKTEQIIGTSRYHDYKFDAREIEIGWTFLDCNYWGGRYNADIKRLMLAHAFTCLDCVVFWVAKDNLRSQHAMTKIGGVLREGEFSKTDGEQIFPYVVFEIRKQNFLSGSLKDERPKALIEARQN